MTLKRTVFTSEHVTLQDFFHPRLFPGMMQLSITRTFFVQILKGEKKIEFRTTSKQISTLCTRGHVLLKNGRSNSCPYMVVEIAGHRKSSIAEVRC